VTLALLRAGADANRCDSFSPARLLLAAARGNFEVVRRFIVHASESFTRFAPHTCAIRESQRDSAPKPRVARHEATLGKRRKQITTPTGLRPTSHDRQTKRELPQPRCG